eukprot:TRINITY_DN11336_c0_g1_i2.p1 TRINITY_DN11336_c0_g1~~TRINITY_DN11336_c0_g1_i2.p1  ORF type:complete len:372 (-),score=42.29 TRINITY_DN11336_c0_g1_i2:57-1172(-)
MFVVSYKNVHLKLSRRSRIQKNRVYAQNRLPDSGYFSEADPNAEVYTPAKLKKVKDITQRGDRYTSDFIWNTNWQEQLDAEQKQLEDDLENKNSSKNGNSSRNGNGDAGSGFLSLNRVNDVFNSDSDLSEQFASIKKQQSKQNKTTVNGNQKKYTNPPTQAETKRWSRGGKFGKRAVALQPTNSAEDEAEKAVIMAEKQRYEQLKLEFQLWAVALTAISGFATYAFYPREVALSYLLGALGGFVYLRLLSKSVDSYGSANIGGLVGQPRLLIPVILVLAFNRWNKLYADDFGLQLQLLPTLIGFFTYKGAVVARQSVLLFQEMMSDQKTINTGKEDKLLQSSSGETQQSSRDVDLSARSVDRAFVKKILSQ